MEPHIDSVGSLEYERMRKQVQLQKVRERQEGFLKELQVLQVNQLSK